MTATGQRFLERVKEAGLPTFTLVGNLETATLVAEEAGDGLLDLLMRSLNKSRGPDTRAIPPAEGHRQPVDGTAAPTPWSPGDVFWLASGLGFPEVEFGDAVLMDAASWRAALDAADPATLEALRGVLAE